MANIPVEKTSGGAAWLPWLLGLLALAALIWLGFELFDDEPDADELAGADDNVGVIDDVELGDDQAGAPAGTIDTGVDTLRTVAALDETIAAARDGFVDLDGLVVALEDVEVQSLAGDSTFYIGSGDDRTLVVLATLGESAHGPGDGSDGVYNVDRGGDRHHRRHAAALLSRHARYGRPLRGGRSRRGDPALRHRRPRPLSVLHFELELSHTPSAGVRRSGPLHQRLPFSPHPPSSHGQHSC